MKNKVKLFAAIAIAAMVMFTFACGGDEGEASNNGDGGEISIANGEISIDSGGISSDSSGKGDGGPLVGKWYYTQAHADESLTATWNVPPPGMESMLEIFDFYFVASNGDIVVAGYEFTSDGRIIVAGTGLKPTYTATANTVTMSPGSGTRIADYTISGTELTIIQRPDQGPGGFVDGTYYKPKGK
jgi:hypothetical protein